MKAYTVEWNNGVDMKDPGVGEEYRWGDVTVVADSLTKAIRRFEKEYRSERIIKEITVNSDDALVDMEPSAVLTTK